MQLVFEKPISPISIIERSLGDSWLLGAIASVAEYPQLLEKLFVNTNIN